MGFDIFSQHRAELPPPLDPIPGSKYFIAFRPGRKKVEINWTTKATSDWKKILEVIRKFPNREYNAASKKWELPWNLSTQNWLKQSGWPEPVAGDEDKPKPDPRIKQKALIDKIQLDPEGTIIPGLRPYQVDFLKFAQHRHGRVALGDDMGTGKTVQSLAWMVYANAYPALFVVNAPTKLQWQSAYRRWVGSTKKHYPDVTILYGKTPYELSKDRCYIINWDILAEWVGHYKKDPQTEEYHFVADGPLARVGFRLLVGDEVQAIGNPDSNRSIAFKALSEIVPHVIGMSGTPAMSKPKQFWPLLSIVEPKHFNNRYRFLYRYCDPQENDHGNKTWDGASNVEELHELLVGCMLRRTKDEVMKDLPPKTVEAVPLEVDKKAMQEYLQEEKEAFSGGTTYSGDDSPRARVAKLLRTAFLLKEKAMYDWLDDFLGSGPKLLLFAWHRDVVDLLCKNLYQWNPSKLYGGMTPTERQEAIDKFINTRSCRLMVANIQAGGVGIDGLQDVASNVAFAEFAHTPNYHRQAIDRLHRGGQTKPVTAYYLVAPGTIDMDAMEVLDSRAKMLDSIMDGKETAGTDLITEILERRGMKTY